MFFFKTVLRRVEMIQSNSPFYLENKINFPTFVL
nr:MAG TPA: hypothetical protein [Herelleviridae sp.]